MAIGDERLERGERARRGDRARRGGEERVDQRRVAGNRTRVGERQLKLRVVGVEAGPLGDLADVMADGEADVPQRIEKPVQEALVLGPERPGKEDQQIDVGMQTQLAPPVAAEGEDADRLRGVGRLGEQLLEERVHPLRVLLQRDAPAIAPLGGDAQFGACRFEPRRAGRAGIAGGAGRRGKRGGHLGGLGYVS